MSDGLLSYDEAQELAREMMDDAIDSDPDGMRAQLRIASGAPVVVPAGLLRRAARVGMLTRAVEVRCERECDHFDRPRYAWLRFGIVTCRECIEEKVWEDLGPREGADVDCDVCGAPADPSYGLSHQLTGESVVMVLGRVCAGCAELHDSLVLAPAEAGVSLN